MATTPPQSLAEKAYSQLVRFDRSRREPQTRTMPKLNRDRIRGWLEEHVPREVRFPLEHGEPEETYLLRRRLGRGLGAKGWLYPTAPTE